VIIFALGGLAGAIFYLPFKRVKRWAWESYWLVYAVAGLLVVPWALMFCTAPNAAAVLKSTPGPLLGYCFLCGALWGVGGLTWGLMIRYLGVGLGLAIGCGLCSAAGTIIPPILAGEAYKLYGSTPANVSLLGVLVSIAGIVLVGMAGMSKENELPEEQKKKAVAEYDFKRGILVAVFSGLTSAGMSFGLQGAPIVQFKAQYGSATRVAEASPGSAAPAAMAAAKGLFYDKDARFWVAPAAPDGERTTTKTWAGIPVLVVVLLGGLAVNLLWCLLLNAKNRTFGDYTRAGAPLAANVFFAGLAGAIWCSQFICFKTGEPRMGSQAYVGWAVLMASAIAFSTLLGILLGEWKGVSGRTRCLLAAGLAILVASAVITGYGNKLKAQEDQSSNRAAPAGRLTR
jgi:L-rhamnose-H+ transport protein